MEIGKTQQSTSQRETTTTLYYFDIECLPITPEWSVSYGTLQEPAQEPHLELINEGNIVSVQKMKATKRSFNVFKCKISNNYPQFRVRVDRSKLESSEWSFSIFCQWTEDKVFNNPFFGQIEDNQINKIGIYKNKAIIIKPKSEEAKPIVISTDIGGTLCGIPQATQIFMEKWIENFYFDKRNVLIYNTGRSIRTLYSLMRKEGLILPDYFIGRCGTNIFRKDKTTGWLVEDQNWKEEMIVAWNPDLIQNGFKSLREWLTKRQRDESDVSSLRYNCSREQFELGKDLFFKAQNQLLIEGVLINSVIREKKGVMHIEIVPHITNKGSALEYVLLVDKIIQKPKISTNQDETELKCVSLDSQQIIKLLKDKINLINKGTFQFSDVTIKSQQDEGPIIYCFGDTMNDDGMLQISEVSVAMKNSENQLLEWVEKYKQIHKNLIISDKCNGYALIDYLELHC